MTRQPTRKRLREVGFGLVLFILLTAGCSGNTHQENQRAQVVSTAARTVSKVSLERYDLLADEKRGGHTVSQHVGRSDLELMERLHREREISAASTWTNLEVAEETVAEALNVEHSKVERWEARGERRANLALHFDAGHVIGRTILRGASKSEPCDRAVIVLRSDGPGFFVLTTYPEVQ